MPVDAAAGRLRMALPRAAPVLGIATLLAMVAALPVGIPARGGSGGLWVTMIPFAVVGAVVARRQPQNPIGPILLLLSFAVVASSDAGQYSVLRYRDGHRGLPLAQVAVFLAPGTWMWLVVLLPLPLALFPDGRLSRRWRRVLWADLAIGAVFVVITLWQGASGILAPHLQVDKHGQLAGNDSPAFLAAAYPVVILLYLAFGLAWALRLLLDFRRSTGDYRQQLKWLLSGGGLAVVGLMLEFGLGMSDSQVLRGIGNVGLLAALLAIPIGLGVSILKYRLYDIDRLISRTLSYTILTGLLVGVFVGIVVLTTHVLPFSSPVAVAASTLAAAALFNPLRLRVQRLVDRRFNRSRYDAEVILSTFTAHLRDAVDVETVRGELLHAVRAAIEPAHASVWIRAGAGQQLQSVPAHPSPRADSLR